MCVCVWCVCETLSAPDRIFPFLFFNCILTAELHGSQRCCSIETVLLLPHLGTPRDFSTAPLQVCDTLDVPKGAPNPYKDLVVRRTNWKTIRIFVSSTFKDFHREREILVKEVSFSVYRGRGGLP